MRLIENSGSHEIHKDYSGIMRLIRIIENHEDS